MRISSQSVLTSARATKAAKDYPESGRGDSRSKRFPEGSYGGLSRARAIGTSSLALPTGENGNGVVENKATFSLEDSKKQLITRGTMICGNQATANELLKILMGVVQPSRKDLINLGARINEDGTVTYRSPGTSPSLTILENWTEV